MDAFVIAFKLIHMNLFGLIGYPLSHSFSKKYFTEKFEKENIKDNKYELFEIKDIAELPQIIKNNPELKGLNVTIPHKESVIKYLDAVDDSVKKIKAVNVISVGPDKKLTGHNSDYYGFKGSLQKFLPHDIQSMQALVLGSGGSAKAVRATLEDIGIPYQIVSRRKEGANLSYEEVDKDVIGNYKLIINTTPVGMYPHIKDSPFLPYPSLTKEHYLFDLIYNPQETLFLLKGKARGARTKGGLEMLYLQAEKAWEIWNSR
jgi:shikimate dehydrogenase